MRSDLFPQRPESTPEIYAYRENNPEYDGLLKVGYSTVGAEKRVAQQYPTKRPDGMKPYEIVHIEPAMRDDGTVFSDHEVRAQLGHRGYALVGGEWVRCTVDDVRSAVIALRTRSENTGNRTQNFPMRPEQTEAVTKTVEHFSSAKIDSPARTPKFLWNAKMRFGKTFAAYQLAKLMEFKRVLVLTFKPAVEAAWEEDLNSHIDFGGWQFVCRGGMSYEECDQTRPIVCFGSFQDYLGNNENGGIKVKNEWVHDTAWDIVIFDEYHFGAWRKNAKNLFKIENEENNIDFDIEKYSSEEAGNAINETSLPISSDYYLYLSGTPFRAMNDGEFIEEQIYSWTYSDEQRAKAAWTGSDNPYAALPRMVMMTYKIPEEIRRIASQGEFDEFDLNVFFAATGKGDEAVFTYENEVQKWLDLIRGAHLPATIDELKSKNRSSAMPYSKTELLKIITHTLWFLPNVASCFAMRNLLAQRQNTFYHDYIVNVCAGTGAGTGAKALPPVLASMAHPLKSKTITLSCGKLTTGVTVKPWTGIFMLRNLKSPETYFQAAFRVQSPWEITSDARTKEILKHECYVFDFALDRALKQIAEYSGRLNVNEPDPEKRVAEFIKFLPVLAFQDGDLLRISAQAILDIAMAGTSATMLAKRWESALLVNVTNADLSRLMANKEAMRALMDIEAFRSLNTDIETVINKSESVKKARAEGEESLSAKDKKVLTAEEKEYKSLRKDIQKKLIKLATRIPIFMYLTDFREMSLRQVIAQVEPQLFKKVTGLEVKDFELLVSLNVFNGALMNDAVYQFKRYEDASLSYTGIDKHEGQDVGGWDTVLKREEYEELYGQQQSTMDAPAYEATVFEEIKPARKTARKAIKKDAGKGNVRAGKSSKVDTTPNSDGKSRIGSAKPGNLEQSVNSVKGADDDGNSSTRREVHINDAAPRRDFKFSTTPVATRGESGGKMKLDLSWVEPEATVQHKKFGEGKVLEIHDTTIVIQFTGIQKNFMFPNAFEDGYLK